MTLAIYLLIRGKSVHNSWLMCTSLPAFMPAAQQVACEGDSGIHNFQHPDGFRAGGCDDDESLFTHVCVCGLFSQINAPWYQYIHITVYHYYQYTVSAHRLMPCPRHHMCAQVFGKVMVCKDLDAAAAVSARAPHLSCCTPKGDQVSKKGTVTGGYLDPTRSSFAPPLVLFRDS